MISPISFLPLGRLAVPTEHLRNRLAIPRFNLDASLLSMVCLVGRLATLTLHIEWPCDSTLHTESRVLAKSQTGNQLE